MGVMKPLICKYCDSEWDSMRSKKSYMAQDSLDCIYCMYCDKPNFIAFDTENETQYNSRMRKARVIQILKFYSWVPILIVYIAFKAPNLFTVMIENFRRTILFLFVGAMFLGVPIIPITYLMVPKKKRKKLMWTYGHLSKTTFKEAKC